MVTDGKNSALYSSNESTSVERLLLPLCLLQLSVSKCWQLGTQVPYSVVSWIKTSPMIFNVNDKLTTECNLLWKPIQNMFMHMDMFLDLRYNTN